MNREERIQYLEDERVLLWKALTELKSFVEKTTPEYQAEAKLAAEQAVKYKNEIEVAQNSIYAKSEYIDTYVNGIKDAYESIIKNETHAIQLASEIVSKSENVHQINSFVVEKSTEIQAKITEIEKIFENKPLIDEKLKNIETIFTRADDTDSKISVAAKSILDYKKEIDKTYYEIYGYVDFDEETQNEVEYDGLVDKLEKSYNQISQKLTDIDNQLTELKRKSESEYEFFLYKKSEEFAGELNQWKIKYDTILKKIQDLLPNAMTAGLSHAYYQKRRVEFLESKTLKRNFFIGIVGLVIVSLIPFGISTYLLWNTEATLEDVILKIPRMVLAILPLYIPVLWVAYSSNRKLNLSKRLIEEYSHKETLSKTFEGLSHQIKNIEDKEISNDLKIKLLYNILEVNSENPGKLISDYNKSDHPLMDALDKSIKLTNAVTKLANIPGFGKLATSIEKRSQKLIEEQKRKVEAGIEINDEK